MRGKALVLLALGCASCGRSGATAIDAGGPDASLPENGTPCPADANNVPTGSCSGSGSCTIDIVGTCKPGMTGYVPELAIFQCDCQKGEWQCTVVGGALGLIPCGTGGSGS